MLQSEAFPAALQDALGERYELRRLLGRGGMASVYLAYDRKHRRAVAIKVLPTRELEVLADSLAALTVELIAERPLLP